jgi:fibrillarin-like rRNA methylase
MKTHTRVLLVGIGDDLMTTVSDTADAVRSGLHYFTEVTDHGFDEALLIFSEIELTPEEANEAFNQRR